jgi:hypothetical protein
MNKIIGKIIEDRVNALNMDKTEFAKRLQKNRSNAYDIFSRDSISTKLLKKIGQVLEHDFFEDLLEPSTKQKIIVEASMSNKVLVEIELQEDEMMKIGFRDKVFKVLNKDENSSINH